MNNQYQGYGTPGQQGHFYPNGQQVMAYGQQVPAPQQQAQLANQAAMHSQQSTTYYSSSSTASGAQTYQQQQQPVQQQLQAPGYGHSIQAPPATLPQPAADYSALLKPPPPPPEPIPVSRPQNDCQPSYGDSTVSQTMQTQRTTTSVERYEGEHAGGEARKAAEAKGDAEVQLFERKVQTMIRRMGICPAGYDWYCGRMGYLCGGGGHLITHMEIDKYFKNPRYRPAVEGCNSVWDPMQGVRGTIINVHPPQVDFWQPMHTKHALFVRQAYRRGFAPVGEALKTMCPCWQDVQSGEAYMGSNPLDLLKAQGRDPSARSQMSLGGAWGGSFGGRWF